MPCQPKVGHVSFLGPLDHTQIRAGALFCPSQLSGSERDSQTPERACSSWWNFSCTLRLDPHAAFPDTRSRSLNIHSVSKNVPDRNPFDCAFMLTLDGWDSAPFSALSTPKQNPALKVLSTPAHQRVTQAVGRLSST